MSPSDTALTAIHTALSDTDMAPPCDYMAHTAPAMLTLTTRSPLTVHVLVMGTRLSIRTPL